jgi:AcrR family transcriptional regulator
MTVLVESDQDAQSTKERIKRGARKLFALHGVDAVTVRDIVRESKTKNASALNYYFGSKEELIQTLICDALAAANQRWDTALSALEKDGGPTNIRQVIEILVLRGLPQPRRTTMKRPHDCSRRCSTPGAVSLRTRSKSLDIRPTTAHWVIFAG